MLKAKAEFFWYRVFEDGRIEHEFDLESGAPVMWGKETPPGIKEVGWLPMTADLSAKIAAYGESGQPTRAPPVTCKLHPGEVPIVYRDRMIIRGAHCTCKICGNVFVATAPPKECIFCHAEPTETASPLTIQQASWWVQSYVLGIKDRFVQTFDSHGIVTE
jgi:hypothetical protein